MIDSALSDVREALEEEQLTCESEEANAIRERCITHLGAIYGQEVVENMSSEFADYIVDCYEAIPT